MADDRRTNFAATVLTLYRNNFGLFWRIMIPMAIIAILLHIGVFFRSVNTIEKHFNTKPDKIDSQNLPPQIQNLRSDDVIYTVTGNLNTLDGIHPHPIPSQIKGDTTTDLSTNGVKDTRSSPYVSWRFFPIPYASTTNTTDKTSWEWTLRVRSYDYTPLILMLLTLCPLSLVIARLSSDVPPDSPLLTAREAWRQTGKKVFLVLVAFVLFVLFVDIGYYINVGIGWLIPSLLHPWFVTLMTILVILTNIYFLVTLSLYNPCLILENRSIIGIFKRSHALVSSARLRFLWIYLLTGWIAAVFTSVLLGTVLLLFSVFFSELAPIREALTPLKFLSLFVGGNVAVMLSNLPGIFPTVLLLIVKGIITALIIPIWAIVTTRLYLERVENVAEAK